MLGQGVLLMVAGMGTVTIFLVLMVLVMQAVGVYFKTNAARFIEPAQPVPSRKAAGDDNEVMAVMLAAVTAHLRK